MAAGLGAAAYVFKDSDPEYSAKCAKYAKALLEFGTKHVGNNTGGIGGFYSTDAQYQDEEAIAQAWLWIVGEGDKPTRVPKNKDYGGSQYDGWVYSWDKVWQGYATLMYKATGDSAFRDELIVEIDGQGGMKVGKYNTNGWGTSRINCAIQMDAYTVADGDPNSEYAQGAKWQLDYILGDNNLGYSFLLGFGDKWPVHIHHRAANPGGDGITSAQNPAAKYTNYGMLVGGIDANGYEDHADRYQYTEGALDYNGCFAIASACAANLFGGDATTFDAIKNSAAEINADFKFADETVTPPEDNPPPSNPPADILYGDANCDGKVTIADAAAIFQYICNSDNYTLSEEGKINADVNGQSGITPDDGLTIQKVDAGMISVNDLPLTR